MARCCSAEAAGMGAPGMTRSAALYALCVFHAGRQVVADHRVPQRQQAFMQRQRAFVIPRLDRIPQFDAGAGGRAQDGRDGAVRPQH